MQNFATVLFWTHTRAARLQNIWYYVRLDHERSFAEQGSRMTAEAALRP
jgi:hypothetical protein